MMLYLIALGSLLRASIKIKHEYKASLAIVAHRENPLLVLIYLSQRQE